MKDQNFDLPKAYDASKVEDEIYKSWEEAKLFQPNMDLKKSFTISMPPPNATGTLHLGHATMLAFEDLMIRFKRMQGYSALWLPGTDHAAIATQSVVEKKLQKAGMSKPREVLGREGLLKEIREFVAKSQDTIRNQVRKMGASCDWTRERYTLDEDLNVAVNTFFKYMYEDGLIYRGNRIVNWDPNMQTTVADDELEYVEERSKFYYLKYGPVVIGTARPETKFLDKVIVVHPDDERYKDLVGKEFDVDWIEGTVKAKVIADPCIDMNLGTGAMTITPAHSQIDFELAEKYDLEVTQIIDFEGKIRTEVSAEFGGLDISVARKKVLERLEEKGLLTEVDEKYVHSKAVNYRGKGLIEPQVMKQWFIDVNKKVIDWKGEKCSLKEVLLDVISSKMIQILPERFSKTYFHWISNLRDWCISRQIWWGHQIPVWYRLTEEKYNSFLQTKDASSFVLQVLGGEIESKFSIDKPKEEGFWVKDPDTLDTWFSSALWTFSTLGWPKRTEDFIKFHPTSVLETGYDILFFWVARMILASTYALRRDGVSEENSLPFKTVYLHGLIRDRDGKKMSKSKPETCIDPLDMISKYGADALRLSLLIGSSPGNDMRLYEEKIAGYRNFVNKIWNISRFVLSTTDEVDLNLIEPKDDSDYWILSRLEEITKSVTADLNNHNFSKAGEEVYEFLWNDFADWYLEISKITGGKDKILRFVLRESLKLLHPFIPFVTEYLFSLGNFSENQLIIEKWPEVTNKFSNEACSEFSKVKALIGKIRSERSFYKIEPKILLNIIVSSGDLKNKESIIKKLGRIEEIIYDHDFTPTQGDIFISEGDLSIYLRLNLPEEKIVELISRLEKELIESERFLNVIQTKLRNENFVKNAKEEIIEEERRKEQETVENIVKLKARLKDFISLN